MRVGFRQKTTAYSKVVGGKPGPNCPVTYSVDPSEESMESCWLGLQWLKSHKPDEELAIKAAEEWLDTWHWENNRLPWKYLTLRKGLNNPEYAAKFQKFHASESLLRLIRAPNQVGKSYAAAAEVWFYAIGQHPWKTLHEKWTDPRQQKLILIITGSDKNREGVMSALWNLCPVSEIDWNLTVYDGRNLWGQKNPSIFIPKTNTKILFRASNQDAASLNSLTADLIWIDEPPKQDTIDEIRRAGIVKEAPVLMTFTPVGEVGEDFTWLQDYVEGDEKYRASDGAEGTPPVGNWFQVVIGIEDCPWFDTEKAMKIRSETFRSEQADQRLYGAWQSAVSGRNFSNFVTAKHVTSVSTVLSNWSFAVGVDYGEKAGSDVAVLVAFDRTLRRVFVLDEYVSRSKTTTQDDAKHIRAMLERNGLTTHQIAFWVGDINTGGKETRGEPLNRILGAELGVAVIPPYKYAGSVEVEERRINLAFQEDRLIVFSRCVTLLNSIKRYRGDGSEEDKKLKHSLDALRYATQRIFNILNIGLPKGKYAGHKVEVRNA